jgi:L-seryl-tRNA(Ser) seleniumtransferase
VRERARRVHRALHDAGVACEIRDSSASVGAGAFPAATLPSVALALTGDAERWAAALRAGTPAVVGRVQDGRLLLDLRAVPDADVPALISAVVSARG